MISLILAAGYATRLYPLTKNFPKPLLEVGGKTVLDWLMEDIDQIEGIERHVVVTNSRYYHQFLAWSQAQRFKRPITVIDNATSTNETRRGAVRDILLAIEREELDDDLLVLAGDNLLDFSLKGFVQYFHQKKATCIMRHHEPSIERLKRTGVIGIDDDERVLQMQEKPQEPKTRWAVPPFYVYERSVLPLVRKALREGCDSDAPGSFIAWLAQKRPVYAHLMEGKRWDIGTLESYERVKREFSKTL